VAIRDHNLTGLATIVMTRLRAIVIGGGLVAGACTLIGCAADPDPIAIAATAAAPAADAGSEPAADTRDALAESEPDSEPQPEATSTPAATPEPQPEATSTPAATPDLWTAEPKASNTLGSGLTSPLAASIVDLPAAPIGPIASTEVQRPVGLRLPTLGIDEALVVAVGVEANGDFEVPSADEVGWYRFGPTPGGPGSAVLAAHVAQDGVDGVFRYLTDLKVGAEFSVVFDDGAESDFRVAAMDQYDKDELPTDDFFRKSGEPQLVLITCGGDFNRQLRSYDDNVVAVAVPI